MLFWFLIPFLSEAQSVMYMNLDEFYKQFNTYEYGKKIGGESVVRGSPYEKEEFTPGIVVAKSGNHYIGIPLRYNIYTDEIEYKFRDRGVYAFGQPELIDSVYIGKEKFVYGHYSTGNRTIKGYFRVLTEKNPVLLQKMNVSIKPAESAQAYKDYVPPAFDRTRDDYFLISSSGELIRINDKKDLQALFSDHLPDIEQFVKSNRIKFTKQDDLLKLMEYYYSLTKE